MRLRLNHDYRYAVEQMALMLFPMEPLHGEEAWSLDSALHFAPRWVTARAELTFRGNRYVKSRRVPRAALRGKVQTDRLLQQAVKLSFYDAAVAALGQHPAWGALTGVRPAKLAARLINERGPAAAERTLHTLYHVSPRRAALAMRCAEAGEAALSALAPRDVGLYLGIPFCPTRCAYCSFVSAGIGQSGGLVEPYLAALFGEIAAAGRLVAREGLRVTALYVGGGTPTTLTAGQLDALLSNLAAAVPLGACHERTVEAGRPDTITADKLAVLRGWGINRVSVNPQSMDNAVLHAMGRAHSARQILEAWDLVRNARFPVCNMDLIAGLPADSAAGFQKTLDTVLNLGPENITVHTLALKRGAALMEPAAQAALPSDSAVASMLDYALDALPRAGYAPYYLYRQKYMAGSFENVGWCKPGTQSAYNICMMEELCSVLALGAGGVTKLVDRAAGRIVRLPNPKYPKEYIERAAAVIERKDGITWPTS